MFHTAPFKYSGPFDKKGTEKERITLSMLFSSAPFREGFY
jgi:hypothetical protein